MKLFYMAFQSGIINSSILVFELNRKFLLYKILTKDLSDHLKNEFTKYYSLKKIEKTIDLYDEKDNINKSSKESGHESDENSKNEFTLTNDLIYEYFSAIVNSFDMSKALNFLYEHALFKNSNYLIRFCLYKNCLILSVYDSSSFDLNLVKKNSDLTKQIYADYYTNWCCKSFLSLIKYKFGLCLDEKCFHNDKNEIKILFQKWLSYFLNDQVYFLEAIEQLQINEDIKMKCEQFLNDYSLFLYKTESIMDEFDYMDETYSKLIDKDDVDFSFINNEKSDKGNLKKEENELNEFEDFFTDSSRISLHILSYSGKLLYKYNSIIEDERRGKSASNNEISLHSSSLFLILLESAVFLEYSIQQSLDDSDLFRSASSSLSAESAIEQESNYSTFRSTASLNKHLVNEQNEYFLSAASTPNLTKLSFGDSEWAESPIRPLTTELNTFEKQASLTKFKKTNCFLKNSNKSTGFYDVLYVKLTENLCLISIKQNKYSKYCELISDFENLISDFNDILNRKISINLNEENYYLSIQNRTSTIHKLAQKEEKMNKQFLCFFVNKLIIFYEKMTNLKNELNSSFKNKKKNSNQFNFISKFNISLKPKLSFDEAILNNKKNSFSASRSSSFSSSTVTNNSIEEREEMIKRNAIRSIHTLQVKLNLLTNSKQFKYFINSENIENNNEIKENEDISSYYNNLENQISAIKSNLNELFYELFLSNSKTVVKDLIRNTNNQKLSPSFLFKSHHIIEKLKSFYKKHLYDYTAFIDLKFRRNFSMAYFSYSIQGLIHFSFVNRQDDSCLIPSIDSSLQYNLDENKIRLAYRKYLPIVLKFLYKNDCTQFQFNDDKLEIVFSYNIWFEDKNSNKLPVDFNALNQFYINYYNDREANQSGYQYLQLGHIIKDREKYFQPGITDKNYFEYLKAICYPNAPSDSLTCYELITLHSSRLNDEVIKSQIKYLKNYLPRVSKQ